MDQVEMLINILQDSSAHEDEKHDAIMDIGELADIWAIKQLTKIAANPSESAIILDACGEALGAIFVKKGYMDRAVINQLTPIAQKTTLAYIAANKPEWIEKYHLEEKEI